MAVQPSGTGSLEPLSEKDLAFLAALRNGESANGYARRSHYSIRWAKWKSAEVRRKLGVKTIGEAIAMSETAPEGVSKADFEALRQMIDATNKAVMDLSEASTAREKEEGKEEVRVREMDEREMAKKLGISLDDVSKIREEREYERYKKFEERRAAELAEEEGSEEERRSTFDQMRDGLGGIKHRVQKGTT